MCDDEKKVYFDGRIPVLNTTCCHVELSKAVRFSISRRDAEYVSDAQLFDKDNDEGMSMESGLRAFGEFRASTSI